MAMDSTGTLSTNSSCFLGFRTRGSAFGTSNKTDKKMENICLSSRSFTTQHPLKMLLGIASIRVCSPAAQMIGSSASGTPASDMQDPTMIKNLSLKLWPILTKSTHWTSLPSTNFFSLRGQQTRQYRSGTCAISQEHYRPYTLRKMQ